MTNDTERANDLIRALVEGLIAHPHALELTAKHFPGATYWTLRPHADDYSKIIGKEGSHVKALTFLIKAIGKAQEELHTLKVPEPDASPRRESMRPKAATSYDPRPARELLSLALEHLALGPFVVEAETRAPVNPGIDQFAFTFWITIRTQEDYETLTVPKDGPGGMTIVGALGTLFRARARRDGVKFYIEVRRP